MVAVTSLVLAPVQQAHERTGLPTSAFTPLLEHPGMVDLYPFVHAGDVDLPTLVS